MDQQKIDRFFQEKLDGYEVAPSKDSWAKVEKQLGRKSNATKFYWVAAAVAAFVVTYVVWPVQQSSPLTPIASPVNHPVMEIQPELNIPLVADIPEEEKTQVEKPKTKVVKQSAPVQLAVQQPPQQPVEQEVEETIPAVDVALDQAVAMAEVEEMVNSSEPIEETSMVEETVEAELINEPLKVDLSKVKITYIAASGEETKQKKDSVGGLKKFIAFAGKLSPGNVLADIRTAKDDLISSGFRSKQKDSSSL